jgi:hypothetical protein
MVSFERYAILPIHVRCRVWDLHRTDAKHVLEERCDVGRTARQRKHNSNKTRAPVRRVCMCIEDVPIIARSPCAIRGGVGPRRGSRRRGKSAAYATYPLRTQSAACSTAKGERHGGRGQCMHTMASMYHNLACTSSAYRTPAELDEGGGVDAYNCGAKPTLDEDERRGPTLSHL